MTAIRSPSAAAPATATTRWTSSASRLQCPAGQGARNHAASRSACIAGLTSAWCCMPAERAEVFLEGAATRHGMLSRDASGPRAVLNALDRLAGSYQGQCAPPGQDLAIAEGQLRDHQARLGSPFAHDAYLAELTGLRDQLKAGLSQATPEPGADPLPPVAETGRADQGAESRPHHRRRTRSGRHRRRIAAEEPVTARIRRRTGTIRRPAVRADLPHRRRSRTRPPERSLPSGRTDAARSSRRFHLTTPAQHRTRRPGPEPCTASTSRAEAEAGTPDEPVLARRISRRIYDQSLPD